MTTLLYRCLIGSRLYGTHTDQSDWDFLEVYDLLPNKRVYSPTHKIVGETDITKMCLSTFMLYAGRGSHQILEAMFAPDDCVWEDSLRALRKGYRCDTGRTVNLYRRTIRNFLSRQGPKADKSYRAALRMCFHLDQIVETARFNPRLTPQQVSLTTRLPDTVTVDFIKNKMGWST